jgi:hypothetical protein
MKTAPTKGQLLVQNTIVFFTRIAKCDILSLTDFVKVKNPDEPKDVVKNWLRSRSTIDFWGYGKESTTQALKGSNSTPLKIRQEPTVLLCPLAN